MAEVTNELTLAVSKRTHQRFSNLDGNRSDTRQASIRARGHLAALQFDVNNIHGVLARRDGRLERIERRLALREMAEPQAPFRHEP